MIVRTEAIVLRSMRYGESSRIATLFTRTRGKLSVIAKGARRTRSRFGSALLPMSHIEVVVYIKDGRSLQTLSEAAHVLRFPNLAKDLRKITIGLRIIELIDAVLQEEQQSPGMFKLTVETLQRLNFSTQRIDNLLPFFELRLAAELGFAPLIRRDEVEGLTNNGGYLAFDSGTISSSRIGAYSQSGSRKALRAFAIYASADADIILKMAIDERTRSEVEQLVDAYLRYHLEESYPSRSRKVIDQMLN